MSNYEDKNIQYYIDFENERSGYVTRLKNAVSKLTNIPYCHTSHSNNCDTCLDRMNSRDLYDDIFLEGEQYAKEYIEKHNITISKTVFIVNVLNWRACNGITA